MRRTAGTAETTVVRLITQRLPLGTLPAGALWRRMITRSTWACSTRCGGGKIPKTTQVMARNW
jgi:hypothetical protein